MKSFLIDSFSGGLSDFEDKGVPGAFKFGQFLDIRKVADTLTAGYGLSDDLAAGTMNGLPLWIVPASNGKTYFGCRGGRIYERASDGTYTLKHTDPDGDILGMEEMPCQNGKTYLFWATATKLHAKELPGNATWSADLDANIVVGATTYTYPKVNLTSAAWHTMKQTVGMLSICNKDTLAMVSWDGSYTNNSLQLIPGNLAKCIVERAREAIVGCDRGDSKEEASVFSWDTTASNYLNKQVFPVKGVNAIIDTEISLLQIGTKGQLFYGDFANLQPILSFPGGGSVNPGGVTNDEGVALFGVFGNGTGKSGIYSYGRKRKNGRIVPNFDYPFDCDEIGAVTKVGTTLLFSYKLGSTYGVKKVNLAARGTGVYDSIDLKLPTGFLKLATVTAIVVSMGPLPAGCSVQAYRRMDKNTSGDDSGWKICNIEGGSTSFTTEGGTEAVFNVGEPGKVVEIRLKLNTSGVYTPEVYKVQVVFDF